MNNESKQDKGMSGCIWAYNRGGTRIIQTRQDGGIDTVALLNIQVL